MKKKKNALSSRKRRNVTVQMTGKKLSVFSDRVPVEAKLIISNERSKEALCEMKS